MSQKIKIRDFDFIDKLILGFIEKKVGERMGQEILQSVKEVRTYAVEVKPVA